MTWEGEGTIVIVIVIVIAVAGVAVLIGALTGGRIGAAVGFWVASPLIALIALIGWALNIRGRSGDERDRHRFCFVPVQYWSVVTAFLGLSVALSD